MASILLIDDAIALAELFAKAVESHTGHEVRVLHALADVAGVLAEGPPTDMALVDLSFNQERGTGLDALAAIHGSWPSTKLAIYTQGDIWVADLLRDAWALLPIATVLSKGAPLDYQLRSIEEVLATGSSSPDPAVQPLLPPGRSGHRPAESLARLVPHAGHAKMWRSLLAVDDATYKELSDHSGLALNTLKNYRSDLLAELAIHDLHDPTLREMREFAVRIHSFLEPHLDAVLGARP